MGRVRAEELIRRNEVEQVYAMSERVEVDSTVDIRQQAIEKFKRKLDAKLANIQEGEGLVVTFNIDIVRSNGKIRGGSGAE